MLQLNHITITHKKDLRELVKDFSFVLRPGDRAAVIGEEGNGKSTLLKLIYGCGLAEDYAEYTGEVTTSGERLGYLAQELSQKEKEMEISEYFYRQEHFYDQTPRELSRLANTLGIPADFFYETRRIDTLSGGEKVKLQLAGLLLGQPDILLLDEPSNDIDLETLEWLEGFLQNCQLPVLYVSHDETLLARTANVIIHLEQVCRKTRAAHTIARMGYTQYIQERRNGLERQEQIARKERSDYAKQMERYRKIQQKVEHRQNTLTRQDPHGGQLLKKKMHAVKSIGRRLERQTENWRDYPDTEEAVFAKFQEDIRIPNGKVILDLTIEVLERPENQGNETGKEKMVLAKQVRLRVQGPEKVCIIGRNGVGKTTLLRRIAEELLERRDIKAAYMPQNYEELLDYQKTPVEFLQQECSKEEQTKIRTYLGSMKYTVDEMEHIVGELSGGQKAKLLFLKMSMEGKNVLILDEPTRNFSPLTNPVTRELLKNFGGCIISASHDRKYIREVCGKVYRLTYDGLRNELLE